MTENIINDYLGDLGLHVALLLFLPSLIYYWSQNQKIIQHILKSRNRTQKSSSDDQILPGRPCSLQATAPQALYRDEDGVSLVPHPTGFYPGVTASYSKTSFKLGQIFS